MEAWTRSRFDLPRESVVSVSQIECAVPGCPPQETVVMFWIGPVHHHFKVFKPVTEMAAEDVPPAWLREALAAVDGAECGCC